MDRQWNYEDRKFGHCKIKWKIRNYSVLSSFQSWKIRSPVCYVRGLEVTKWKMVLEKFHFQDKLFFHLKRVEYRQHSRQIVGDCKVYVCDHLGRSTSVDEYFVFSNNYMPVLKIKLAHSNTESPVAPDCIYIICELLVKFKDVKETIIPCNNLGIKNLSEDLRRLYDGGKNSDVELKFNESYYRRGHKPVLHCRNQSLKKMIDSNMMTRRFIFNRTDHYEECDRVLLFLYTANMEYVVNDPKLYIYELALIYDVRPIIEYYLQDELAVYSTSHTEEYNLTWTVKKFFKRRECCLAGPEVHSENWDISWQLKLVPCGIENDTYIDIFIEFSKRLERLAWVELSLNNGDETVNLKTIQGQISVDQIQRVNNFAEREQLKNYLQNDSLTIGCRLLLTYVEMSKTSLWYFVPKPSVGTSVITYKPYSNQMNYARLSDDMFKLFSSCKFRNFRFRIGTQHCHVNEGILSVRCPTLYSRVKEGNQILSRQTRPLTLQRLLCFIYCAKFYYPIPVEDAFDLYKVAGDINLKYLEDSIIDNLLQNFASLKYGDIRKVYEFANSENIAALKRAAEELLPDLSN